jgi:hypothetical protein
MDKKQAKFKRTAGRDIEERPPMSISAFEYISWCCFQALVLYDGSQRILIPKKNTELDFDSDPNHIIVKINSIT